MTKATILAVLTTLLELLGLALIVVGVALFSIPIACIVAGAGLIGVSYLIIGGRR